ncbi:MAG: hypothetical protein JRI25_27525 [Deltaproteobacteria bacterium]|nr:hypothetical protein [Deltaproteobacteria bacterium]
MRGGPESTRRWWAATSWIWISRETSSRRSEVEVFTQTDSGELPLPLGAFPVGAGLELALGASDAGASVFKGQITGFGGYFGGDGSTGTFVIEAFSDAHKTRERFQVSDVMSALVNGCGLPPGLDLTSVQLEYIAMNNGRVPGSTST